MVLCFSCLEDCQEHEDGTETFPVIDKLNSWLAETQHSPMVRLDEKMCCGKHPQMIVFGAAYNYLSDEGFLNIFRSLEWQHKDSVFLVLNPEHDPMQVLKPGMSPRFQILSCTCRQNSIA
jgi:hypothetical protein